MLSASARSASSASIARETDAALVCAARQGDAGAFGALFRRWHPKLLRHAFNILWEKEAAQDAVQDAWADIYAGLARLKEPSLFGVWCFRIVTRKCNRIVRVKYKTRRIAHDLAALPDIRENETSDVALEMRAVRGAMDALSAEQYLALQLFYLESFSIAEVAVALDIPAGTVKTRLMHARRKIRAALEGEFT